MLEAIKNVLNCNQEVFSSRKANIGCFNLAEHENELDESFAPHIERRGEWLHTNQKQA